MANPTQALIASHTTASGGEASWTFSSIPGTYTDLKLVMSLRVAYTTSDAIISVGYQFNSSTSGYTAKDLLTYSGASPSSGGYTTATYGGVTMGRISDSMAPDNASGMTANTFSNTEMYIPNYTSANYKSWSIDTVAENNGSVYSLTAATGLWSNTAAITSISIGAGGTTFMQNSTFYLYGIKNS